MEWIKNNKIWSIPIGVLIFANLVLMFADTQHEEINFDEYNRDTSKLTLVDEPTIEHASPEQLSVPTHDHATARNSASRPMDLRDTHQSQLLTKHDDERHIKHDNEHDNETSQIRHPQDIGADEAKPPWRMQLVCYEMGPFLKKDELEDASAMIGERAYVKTVDDRTTKEALGYWVYLPPARSRALSRLKVEELKVKGIKDVVLMKKSEPVNSVSLGLYTKKHVAERRVRQIEKIGYQPKMEMRYKINADLWLRASIHKEKDFTEAQWQNLIKQFNNITVISASC